MSAHGVGGDFGVLIREYLSDYFPYIQRGKSHFGDTERGDAIRPQAQFLDMGAARQRLCLHRYVMPVAV